MPLYDIMLVLALARTGFGLVAIGFAPPGHRPWATLPQGAAEVCCALLLRTYLDPPYRATLGGTIYPVFFYAAGWAGVVWLRQLWALGGLGEEGDAPPALSRLDALGLGVSSGFKQVAAIGWHVLFVAPSLVCGAFVAFGLVDELPKH
jgi:hypothetical protein